MALERIKKETKDLDLHPINNVSLAQVEENDYFHYLALIVGPNLSPYEDGIFYLNVDFPNEYPLKPPKYQFMTPIYHLNINEVGTILADFLNDKWNPSLTIGTTLLMINDLLKKPNPDISMVPQIGKLYKTNKFEYYKKAHEFAVKHAGAPKYDKLYYLYGEERIYYELNHMDYGENFKVTKLEDKNKCKMSFKYKKDELNFDVHYPNDYPMNPPKIILTSQLDDIELIIKINSFISNKKWNNKLFMYDIFKDLYNYLFETIPINNNDEYNGYAKNNELKTKILLDHLLIQQKEIKKLKSGISKINKTIINRTDNKDNLELKKGDSDSSEVLIDNILIKNELSYKDYFEITNKRIGFINLGNTCYINSCLQILIHCPLFITELLLNLQLTNDKTSCTNHFLYICYEMKNATKEVDITLFKYFIGNKYEKYKGEKQNDSQEFCRNLLEKMSSELNEVKNNKSPYVDLSNSFSKPKKVRYDLFYDNARKKEKSIITDLFYTVMGTTLKCECNKEFYIFQELLDIPLLIPENTNNTDIISLLRNFFKKDSVEKHCDACKEQKKFSQKNKIARPPDILIISIQRFTDINDKNECNVNFNEILDINEFIDRDCGYNQDSLYSLFGIINHKGYLYFGHYYSYIKINNQDWYEFNDENVKPIDNDLSKCDTSKPYILFYVRIH